jgi:SAM-dependent methyltransferase
MNCLLCQSNSSLVVTDVFHCDSCGLVYKNPNQYSNNEAEFERYLTHKNNENDQGYINFLNKLAIPLAKFLPETFTALDFGCGPGPTLCNLLEKIGGTVFNYDPLFYPENKLLNATYDVVTSSEVVEHFKDIERDWTILLDALRPGGILGIMTLFYNSTIDYRSWWYKNDFTHVVFYQHKTFDYLADRFNLEILYCDSNSVIIFRKKLKDSQ